MGPSGAATVVVLPYYNYATDAGASDLGGGSLVSEPHHDEPFS